MCLNTSCTQTVVFCIMSVSSFYHTKLNKWQKPYQVGRKCVQIFSVSLVSWKTLMMQSLAELLGWRYPKIMLSSWYTCTAQEHSFQSILTWAFKVIFFMQQLLVDSHSNCTCILWTVNIHHIVEKIQTVCRQCGFIQLLCRIPYKS